MEFCIICFFHGLQYVQQTDAGQNHLFISDYTKELVNLQVFSLNSLVALLAVLVISGSKKLQPVVLALIIYTISLRLTVHACFLQNHPTLSLCLHVVPLLTISCMAGVELVLDAQSPALAVAVIVLSVLPLVTIILYHERHCGDTSTALPIRVRDPPTIASSSADAIVGSDQV